MKASVYCIRHLPSGRVYVGSARDTATRWRNHRSTLKQGIHSNPILQEFWQRDGGAAFQFEVLEELADVDDREFRLTREQFWMEKLGATRPDTGLNIHRDARGPHGLTLKPGHKQRIAETLTGHRQTIESRIKKSLAMRGNQNGRKSRIAGEKPANTNASRLFRPRD